MSARGRWAAMLALSAFAWRELWIWMTTGRMGAAFLPVAQDLEGVLFDASRNPPWLIFAVVVLLLVARAGDVARQVGPPGPRWATGLLAILALAMLGWARHVSAPDLMIPAGIAGLLALGWSTGGSPRLRLLAVPCVLLVFAMPIPGVLVNRAIFPLQMWTADYASWVLAAIRFPFVQIGDVIRTSTNNFIVIEACSGMGSIEVLSLLALTYAWYTRATLLHGALLVLAAPIIAFGLNGLRVVTMILNPDSEIVSIHTTQGLVVFAVGALMIALLDALLGRILPQRRAESPPLKGKGNGRAPGLLALAAVAAAAVISVAVPRYVMPPRVAKADLLPSELPDWESWKSWESWERAADQSLDQRFLGTTGYEHHAVAEMRKTSSSPPVSLFLGMDEHRSRLRSLWSDKNLLPGPGWHVEEAEPDPLPGSIATTRLRLRNPKARKYTYTVYWNVGTLWEEAARALLALDQSPFRREAPAYVLRIATEVDPDEGGEFQARLRAYEAGAGLNLHLVNLIGPEHVRLLRTRR